MRLTGMRPLPRLAPRTPVDLRGKRILLTGASSGIGEAAAEKLANHGATVIVVARRAHLLDGVVARITARGGSAIAVPTNLADLDAGDVGDGARHRSSSRLSTRYSCRYVSH